MSLPLVLLPVVLFPSGIRVLPLQIYRVTRATTRKTLQCFDVDHPRGARRKLLAQKLLDRDMKTANAVHHQIWPDCHRCHWLHKYPITIPELQKFLKASDSRTGRGILRKHQHSCPTLASVRSTVTPCAANSAPIHRDVAEKVTPLNKDPAACYGQCGTRRLEVLDPNLFFCISESRS